MQSATILGCRVDGVGSRDAVERMAAFARAREPALVVTLGTEMIVYAQRDPAFREIVNASALSLCDTIGVKGAARFYGLDIPERVSGVDVIVPLCAALAQQGTPIYLLGGKGDTVVRAAAAIRERCPGIAIAGTRDGYFAERDAEHIARAIASSGAGALFVGLGSPRQELFLSRWLQDTGCGVGIGVGGSFDVLAGNVQRAPALMRRLNLEWFYRLLREPSRWRRQLALPAFVGLVVRERIAANFSRRSP